MGVRCPETLSQMAENCADLSQARRNRSGWRSRESAMPPHRSYPGKAEIFAKVGPASRPKTVPPRRRGSSARQHHGLRSRYWTPACAGVRQCADVTTFAKVSRGESTAKIALATFTNLVPLQRKRPGTPQRPGLKRSSCGCGITPASASTHRARATCRSRGSASVRRRRPDALRTGRCRSVPECRADSGC